MAIKSKITSSGLSNEVDSWIVETAGNKSEIKRRLDEKLNKPISYATVSKYVDEWQEERLKNAKAIIKFERESGGESAKWVTDAVLKMMEKSDVESDMAEILLRNISVENGIVDSAKILSVIAIAGLIKVLRNPELVSMGDAMKATQLLMELTGQRKESQQKPYLQQAISIFSGDGRNLLDSIDIVDAEIK